MASELDNSIKNNKPPLLHTDIIFLISEHLNVKDLSSLLRTNWENSRLLQSSLYRRAVQDGAGRLPLHYAARKNNEPLAKLMLEKYQADIMVRNSKQQTALHVAAETGNIDVCLLLLAWGADINAQDASRWTPLHGAVLAGRMGTIQVLLDYGATAHVDELTDGNFSVLELAAWNACADGVEDPMSVQEGMDVLISLVQKGADIHAALKRMKKREKWLGQFKCYRGVVRLLQELDTQ